MRRLTASLFSLVLLSATPALAVMEDYPSVKLQGLDKSVGRTVTFEAKVGSTIEYGPLFIKIQSCRRAPPIEKPESAAFLQIWEVPPGAQKSEWVFSGWMFASSPALSAMDHPVYDVWVLECTGREEPVEDIPEEEAEEAAPVNPTEAAPAAVDSEADGPEPVDAEAAQPQTPAVDPAVPEIQQERTVDPSAMDDPGFTAYDLMKQGGTNATAPRY